jgi:hypothetical protein
MVGQGRIELPTLGFSVRNKQTFNPLIQGLISRKYLKTNKKPILSIPAYSMHSSSFVLFLSQFYHIDHIELMVRYSFNYRNLRLPILIHATIAS